MAMRILFITGLLLMAELGIAQGAFFTKTDAFLKKHVSAGLVDYKAIKDNPAELNELTELIESTQPGTGSTAKAYYINAYNILVIKNVVDHYPINKPQDVSGFFTGIKHNVGGAMLTLEAIEKRKLNASADPRLHFALVCAAKGCPKLLAEAYTPSKLNAQLNKVTKQAINDPVFTRTTTLTKTVHLSQIFEWYKADFLAHSNTLIGYINQYRDTDKKIPDSWTVDYYIYNWTLNVKKK